MKIEVNHHPDSELYIKETFKDYVEISDMPYVINGRTVIHIYPISDTTQDNGELDGYIDAYNCELHIYDTKNNTIHKTIWHDQVELDVHSRIRIFKDLSTMIIIDRPVKLLKAKSFLISEIR